MVIPNKILHCTLKSQFEGTCEMISLGASDSNKISRLCIYLLSGRAGWVDIWLEVHVSWLRAKYFPARLDLTQSIRILSYDHCVWIFCNGANQHQSGCFSSSAISGTFYFSYGFPTKLHTGPFRSHDKNLCTFFFFTTVWTIWLLSLCHNRGLSFSCVIVVVVFFFIPSSPLL